MNDWYDQKEEKEASQVNRSTITATRQSKLVRSFLMGLGALSLIGLGASGVYYGVKQKPEWFGIKNENKSAEAAQAEIAKLVQEIGKIIDLPRDETPTLATVSDLEKVKDQQFFARAQNGDKVLVYSGAKKAYLYRPSEKKIIEVGVVNVSPQDNQQTNGEVAGENIVVTPSTAPTSTPSPKPTPTFTPVSVSTPTPMITP